MRRVPTSWALGIALTVVVGCPSPTLAVDSARLDASIERAKKWLLANQKDGIWEHWHTSNSDGRYDEQKTGWTALALDALLSAGMKPTDPTLFRAIKYLEQTDTEGVYALGLRMQVWERLPSDPQVQRAAKNDSNKLLHGAEREGEYAGMYGYAIGLKAYSHSRAQYAVLGMSSAQRMGVEVPADYWKLVERGWMDHQLSDGGWTYKKADDAGHPPTAGLTAVGVATLFITADMLHEAESIDCKQTFAQPAIARGIKWLADHSDQIASGAETPRNYPYSALYAVERVSAASGLKYFAAVNWFEKGAKWLLDSQRSDGHWDQAGEDRKTMSDMVDTSFALLFLAHGRAPLMMQKLDYSGDLQTAAGWNRRPRDVANLAQFTGERLEQELSWAVVNLASPVAEYHDAPILYLAGSEPLRLNEDSKSKLREFIEGGGMIVGSADCAGGPFSQTFQKLGSEITTYEFRSLPPNHPIFTNQQFPGKKWQLHPQVLGLSNGVRELMILLPSGDFGRIWQLKQMKTRESAFELGADLFEYAAGGGELRARGDRSVVTADPSVSAASTIKLARLKYRGNWDPEPGGWRRLLAVMHNSLKIDLDVRTIPLQGDLKETIIAHLTGTGKFKLPEDEKPALKEFINAGRTLIIDAAGGSTEFAASAESELSALIGRPFVLLADNDPVYSAGGAPLQKVRYRRFQSQARGNLNVPRVKAIKLGDRYAVLLSPDDLSAGLVGEPVDGVFGYEPESAVQIMERLILVAAHAAGKS